MSPESESFPSIPNSTLPEAEIFRVVQQAILNQIRESYNPSRTRLAQSRPVDHEVEKILSFLRVAREGWENNWKRGSVGLSDEAKAAYSCLSDAYTDVYPDPISGDRFDTIEAVLSILLNSESEKRPQGEISQQTKTDVVVFLQGLRKLRKTYDEDNRAGENVLAYDDCVGGFPRDHNDNDVIIIGNVLL